MTMKDKDIRAKYAIASGSLPPFYFKRFCISEHIGTHGDAPSGYGMRQYSNFAQAKEIYKQLPAHKKPYQPVVGIDDAGYSWYIDENPQNDIVHYMLGKDYMRYILEHSPNPLLPGYLRSNWYPQDLSRLDALRLSGCLDSELALWTETQQTKKV